MKHLFSITIIAILLAGCGDSTQDNNLKTSISKTSKSAITIAYGPIGKTGCESQSVHDEDSVAEYLSAAQDGEVLIAQAYLLKIHRDLRCMSAYDFVMHYNNIMNVVESDFDDERSYLYVSPLVFLLAEHGGNHLDYRAQKWLFKASYYLLKSYDERREMAAGIGLHYVRGISLISVEESLFYDLVLSMSNPSWFRLECPLIQSVIIKKANDDRAIVCLNDPCPMTEGFSEKPFMEDTQAFISFCDEQKDKLEASKNKPVTGSGSSGGNSGGVSGDDSYSEAIECANSYNEASDSFACLVQVSIPGQRLIAESIAGGLSGFNVGLESHISAESCSPNPLAQSAQPSSGEEQTSQEKQEDAEDFYERSKFISWMKEELSSMNAALQRLTVVRTAYEIAEEIYQNNKTTANKNARDAARDKYLAATGTTTVGQANLVFDAKVGLRDLHATRIADKEQELREEYPKLSGAKDSTEDAISTFERLKRGWDKSCDPSDPSGCSQTCGIAEQQAAESARCMGMNAVDDRLTGDPEKPPTSGLGNPEEMVRTPEQVELDPDFNNLVSCMADAMGFDPSFGSPGDKCGSQILCTSHENAVIGEDTLGCSCSEQQELESYLDYQATLECQAIILCGQEQTCSCGSFGNEISQGGGLPPDPEVMLRTFANPQESY